MVLQPLHPRIELQTERMAGRGAERAAQTAGCADGFAAQECAAAGQVARRNSWYYATEAGCTLHEEWALRLYFSREFERVCRSGDGKADCGDDCGGSSESGELSASAQH